SAKGGERNLLLVDQLPVDPGALPVGEHLRRDVQRVRIRVTIERDVMRDDDGRQRPGFLEPYAPLFGLRRFFRDITRHGPVRLGYPPEIFRDEILRFLRTE